MDFDPDNDRFPFYCGKGSGARQMYVLKPNLSNVWDLSIMEQHAAQRDAVVALAARDELVALGLAGLSLHRPSNGGGGCAGGAVIARGHLLAAGRMRGSAPPA